MKSYQCIDFRKSLRAVIFAAASLPLITGTSAFAQSSSTDKKDDTVQLEKFTVTGSFIPQASNEPVGPVAVFTESEIRATGAFTPIQALRSLPSFIGNPGPTENDSNGGSGATAVSLRGLGAGQTLVLINGRVTLQFANIQLIPIEAVDRIEVLRDGAGIIYGSAAIGGAVNIILKKSFTGSVLNVGVGGATRSPGSRETFQTSFVAGAASGGTSLMVSGSYFKNRTIFASQRPNSAQSDQRANGGVNGGSANFNGVIQLNGGGTPFVLPPGFSTSKTATLADYVPMDQNTFSSNQLFNFRNFSPSAPGQLRNSLLVDFNQNLIDNRLELFSSFLYSRLETSNGLAPSPIALSAIGAPGGPAVASLSFFGPYNPGLVEDDNDFFRIRAVEAGNRTNRQTYTDYRWQVGLKGNISDNWHWEAAMSVENEEYEQKDGGVYSLVKFDKEVTAGNYNPFTTSFSKGTATINGVARSWDNEAALKRSEIIARIVAPVKNRFYDARINGTLLELPAGEVGFAGGYEKYNNKNVTAVDDLYTSGGVLGLNTQNDNHNAFNSESVFAEVKIPLVSEKNKMPLIHGLSVGGIARREDQTISGPNASTGRDDSRNFRKVNPSFNIHYAPTADYLVRASYSKGFVTPGPAAAFGTPFQNNPTLNDPLGFATNAQTTVVVRSNPDIQATNSVAKSFGIVGTPKDLLKGLTFSVDYYDIDVTGIGANNANIILAANAAGQGPGFIPGNAATINPNAPFASQIRRSANGRLTSNGNFAAAFGVTTRGAVLSDFLNIGSRHVAGIEYTASYVQNTSDWGRLRYVIGANQIIKMDQSNGPGLPTISYLGKSISVVGDPLSPGSLPKWKGNFGVNWTYKNWNTNVTFNYIGSFQDDPLFVLSPKMQAFFNAHTPKSDPAFAAFLAAPASVEPKVGGIRSVDAWKSVDLQVGYTFTGDVAYTKGLSLALGATNVFDKLAPFSAGAFNDSYDTRTHNNIGRFVYLNLKKQF